MSNPIEAESIRIRPDIEQAVKEIIFFRAQPRDINCQYVNPDTLGVQLYQLPQASRAFIIAPRMDGPICPIVKSTEAQEEQGITFLAIPHKSNNGETELYLNARIGKNNALLGSGFSQSLFDVPERSFMAYFPAGYAIEAPGHKVEHWMPKALIFLRNVHIAKPTTGVPRHGFRQPKSRNNIRYENVQAGVFTELRGPLEELSR